MVAQATLLLFSSFFVMLLAGVPISAGIGIASIFTALFSMDPAIFALTAAQRCFSGIDSFSLLALPFFSLLIGAVSMLLQIPAKICQVWQDET